MRKYLAIVKTSYQRVVDSRLNILISNFQAIFFLFVLFFFWQAIFRHQVAIKGYTFPQIVTYYFLIRVTYNRISAFNVARIAKEIKTGEITNSLLRPYNYILFVLAKDFTSSLIWVIGNLISILVFSTYLYGFLVAPSSLSNFLLFMLIFIINGFLAVLINISIGLSAFWIGEVTHLKALSVQIISFLSGGLIPLTFFPLWFQHVSDFLPFRFLVQFPSDVYFGKITTPRASIEILILIGWTLSFYALSRFLFRRGLNNYESFN